MSTNCSQSPHGATSRSGKCRRLTAAALCALSCLGTLSIFLTNTSAQDAPPAAETKTESLDAVLAKKGSLELRDATLADWLLAIQKTWNIDLGYDSDALQQKTWTGKFTDRPLKDILDTILGPNSYGYRRQGNSLIIVPADQLPEASKFEVGMLDVKYANLAELELTLPNLLLSPQGKTKSIPSTKTLMVIDFPENVEMVRKHIAALDERAQKILEQQVATDRQRPAGTESSSGQLVEQTVSTVLFPKFILSDHVIDTIQSHIGDGTVTSVPEMNAVVVTGSQSAVQTAAQIIEKLDVVMRQVRITVLMYDIRVDALEQLGVNWRNAGKGRLQADGTPLTYADLNSATTSAGSSTTTTPTTGTTTTSAATSTTVTAPPGSFVTTVNPTLLGSALTLTHLSKYFDLSAVFLALEQTDGARLLANPNVVCYDRSESQIKIISEIPVQQLTQTDQGGNIGTTTFREAGVTVRVTPWIKDPEHIMLALSPEFSVLTGFQAGTGQPIIDRRTLHQRVVVQNGQTLVIGGLRRRNELETITGIPGLRNLKYLGNIFGAHRTTVEESELVTFIHTEILDQDYDGLLREQVARQIVNETLDQIPVAGHSPYIESCKDPYCPIHNPRPKYHPGSMLAPDYCPPGGDPGEHPEMLPPVKGQLLPPVDGQPLPPVQGPTPAPPVQEQSDKESPVSEEPVPPAPEQTAQGELNLTAPTTGSTADQVAVADIFARPFETITAMRRLPAVASPPQITRRLPAIASPPRKGENTFLGPTLPPQKPVLGRPEAQR